MSSTARKFALVKLALWLEEVGQTPAWSLSNAVKSFSGVSRDLSCGGRIELEGGSWTTAEHILESYVEAGERHLDTSVPMVCEALAHGRESLALLEDWKSGGERMTREVDWAAKHKMLQSFVDSEEVEWSDPALKAYDLAYHDLDPEESLFTALQDSGWVDADPDLSELEWRIESPKEPTRALARSIAVRKYADALVGVSWGCLTFVIDGQQKSVALPPDKTYPQELGTTSTLEEFVGILENIR
jgi:proteasome accessory factor A